MKIEYVKSKEQVIGRAVSILLYKLATADSKDVATISKELQLWYEKMPNRVSNPHQER